jgi:peptidyl-prolyl cis-trans isomerase SurA
MVSSEIGALRRSSKVSGALHALIAALSLGMGTSALAQDAGDSLKLPGDVTIFEDRDPHLHKPTAVVNGQIITKTDVDQRLALIVLANGGKVPDEEMARLRMQVLRNLMDETLQIQEARSQDMAVSEEEVEQSYARIAQQNFGQDPKALDAYLVKIGSSPTSLKRQIRGELSWQRLLRRNVTPYVNVSEDEVRDEMKRQEEARGTEEFRVGEIFLSANSENREAVAQNAVKIVEQLQKGASFVGYARQFSEASTASVGGDLGWIRAGVLPPELDAVVKTLEPGQIAGPIEDARRLFDPLSVLIDKRQGADRRSARCDAQPQADLDLVLTRAPAEAQAGARVKTFAEQMKVAPRLRAASRCGRGEAQRRSGRPTTNVKVRESAWSASKPLVLGSFARSGRPPRRSALSREWRAVARCCAAATTRRIASAPDLRPDHDAEWKTSGSTAAHKPICAIFAAMR